MDLRLIQEFSGDGSVNVIEWLEKAELVCALRGITRLEAVLPLRLTGGAFAVYQQLTAEDKADSGKIKFALKTAFAVDAFTAYELFVARRLQPGETVDVYLAELRRLAVPFGGLPEKALVSAFVAGLPDGAKQLLRAGSRMDDLPLTHILARARAILKDESGVAAVATPAGAASGTVCGVAAVATPAGAASRTVCETRGGRCQRRISGVTRVTSRITSLETVCSAREGEGVCTTGAAAAADEAEVEANSGVTGVTASDTSRRRVRETTEG